MIQYPSNDTYTEEQITAALRYFYCYVLEEKLKQKNNQESAPYKVLIDPIDADYRDGKITEGQRRALVDPIIAPFQSWAKDNIDPDRREITKAILQSREAIKGLAGQFTVTLGELSK